MAKAGSGESDVASKMGEVLATDVAQFDVLEIVPNPLVRVEVRGGRGQSCLNATMLQRVSSSFMFGTS